LKNVLSAPACSVVCAAALLLACVLHPAVFMGNEDYMPSYRLVVYNSFIPKLHVYPNAELFAAQHSGIKLTRRILELCRHCSCDSSRSNYPSSLWRELPNKRFLQFVPIAHEQPRMDVLVAF
jgi:hypothetical protein